MIRLNFTVCDCHAEEVTRIRAAMPPLTALYDLSELFKTFGDTTRIRILWALSGGELCVGDIAVLLEMEPSAISHQLRLLRQARLVRVRRKGKLALYVLDDAHVRRIFELGMEHICERRLEEEAQYE